jgi:hypothetical protein
VYWQNDNGTVVGLKNAKKLLEDLPNKIVITITAAAAPSRS